MEDKLTREDCIALLRQMHARIGTDRYPRRSDFSEREVVAVKAHLGPWPRALEAAGIKPARDDGRAEKNKQKRIRAKRARTAAKAAKKNQAVDGAPDPNTQQKEKENTP